MPSSKPNCAESDRLREDASREKNWKRWGPYLAERQWGTVREDYSANGECWDYFPHEQSRSRAYRWGEDGLLGITDRECRLCFSLALWNGRDPYLKERLFGLANSEGNHGEDVKECYFYLDSTPTHSWMEALYKYPQAEFPYQQLRDENARRGRDDSEYELLDTGVFDESRYWDVRVTYAKAGPNDLLIEIKIANRGPEKATLHVLPTAWFRNTWTWGCLHDGCEVKPKMHLDDDGRVCCDHASLERMWLECDAPDGHEPTWLFTENETNAADLFGSDNASPYVKDAFHRKIVNGQDGAVNPGQKGTKCAVQIVTELEPGQEGRWRLRLYADAEKPAQVFGDEFDQVMQSRRAEADVFYQQIQTGKKLDVETARVSRQADAGLLWSKQFYHYVVEDWLKGDPEQPAPPPEHQHGRNSDWPHLFARDVLSMPDKWEYPWFAAWDLAFHMIPMARLDPEFAKHQLNLLLREWYLHPNGQMPAYEFAFDDVNPPVHAWACWRVYKMTAMRGQRDRTFLARVFQKLLMNFTWWVNRKDPSGNHLFSGGFLGLDNIGVFDRSKSLPNGQHFEQADGTAWMAFYCGTMLSMALELADGDPAYEDIASKFFEHCVAIADAMNHLGGDGLWHEGDGFYYDQLRIDGGSQAMRVRSMVGIIPLFAVVFIEEKQLERLPGFAKRTRWFLKHRSDLAKHIAYMDKDGCTKGRRLLAIPSRERLERVLRRVFDEAEFLSPHGIRSLSKYHEEHPFVLEYGGETHQVDYEPGESKSGMFGGNSNWRGPVWFPLNYLLIESLERYHHFYGDEFTMEYPTGSGNQMNLKQIGRDLSQRMVTLFLPDENGHRPAHGGIDCFASDPHWKDMIWFHEYFHGETGKGLGASHQTGWTALVAKMIGKSGK